MTLAKMVPYGCWKSPITSELIASATIGFGMITVDGADLYWIETRPSEQGRHVIVKRDRLGTIADVTPPGYNARTRVHEYGGGSYTVSDGIIYFSNFSDQRLYRQQPGATPVPITHNPSLRIADFVVDERRDCLIGVCEDHSDQGCEATNSIVSISTTSDKVEMLASGYDFYSNPRLSPDGTRLAWLSWNHPNMPWDGTELWVSDLSPDGSVSHSTLIAGGNHESVMQPEWSPDGLLYFVSDRTNWWNLYRSIGGQIEALAPMQAEFGRPQWIFGHSAYDFESERALICTYFKNDGWHLARLNLVNKVLEPITSEHTDIGSLRVLNNTVVFRGGSPTKPSAIVQLNLTNLDTREIKLSSNVSVDLEYISLPQSISFNTNAGLIANAYFYRPQNKDFIAPAAELPPLLVKSHGGPTSAAANLLNLEIQYWTSRGFAVVDVNYGGSTGFGREYRQRLERNWGLVDVDDCINAAKYLVDSNQVDGKRLLITGGSAGGYTTLCALVFRNQFQAGASYFGIGDLEAMTKDTHKFESRYLDRLIGPYPEQRDLYLERSPVNHTAKLATPIIFFQGLEDKVVLPSQTESMVEAMRGRNLPVAYIAFKGEQHGFRQAETIKRALDAELYFYSCILNLKLSEPVAPVLIENLKS